MRNASVLSKQLVFIFILFKQDELANFAIDRVMYEYNEVDEKYKWQLYDDPVLRHSPFYTRKWYFFSSICTELLAEPDCTLQVYSQDHSVRCGY